MTTQARAAVWVGLAVVTFGVTYLLVLGTRADLVDEAWMLWVTRRLTSGDRLYSDVYFVSTPLAAWISAGVSLVGGVQLTVLRALEAAVFTTQLLVALSIARWCRATWPTLLVFAAAVFAVGSPAAEWVSLYSSTAIAAALVALRLLLLWLDRRREPAGGRRATWVLVGVGLACGVSFTAKPNVGLLTLAAVVVGIAVSNPGIRTAPGPAAREAGVAVLGFAAPVAAMVVALLATGSWNAFVSDVFGDKISYMKVGTSYFDVLGHQLDLLGSVLSDEQRALAILHAGAVMLPIVMVAVVVVAILRTRGGTRRRVIFFSAFVGAALVSMVPRPGANHLAGVAPLALTATLGVVTSFRGSEVSRPTRRFAVGLVGVLALAGFAVVVEHSISGFSDPLVTRSAFAHFDGTAVPKRFRAGVNDIRDFARTHTDGAVFVLREDAGFWYLTTGVRDPLPYDIPEVSDFGSGGEPGVIARLARGEADWVCVKPVPEAGNGVLEPRAIRHWVRTHFEYVATIRQCDMYRRPGATG